MNEFKLWSEVRSDAKKMLTPDLNISSLSDRDLEEKKIILKHFTNKGWFNDTGINNYVHKSIRKFAENFKAKNFCPETLHHGGPHYAWRGGTLEQCCLKCTHQDFWSIFLYKSSDVVYELLAYYVNGLNDLEYKPDKTNFQNCFNDIFDQFALDIVMSNDQFLPRQEERITTEIYEPTLSILGEEKWREVDSLFSDAFSEYRKNTPQGYSNCVTNIISGVQAFLQILVNEKTGKGDISKLIPEAQKQSLIPNDYFSSQIFANIESIFARERQEKSIAHPKKQYANEKNARMVMNLAMVFIQHCLQK